MEKHTTFCVSPFSLQFEEEKGAPKAVPLFSTVLKLSQMESIIAFKVGLGRISFAAFSSSGK